MRSERDTILTPKFTDWEATGLLEGLDDERVKTVLKELLSQISSDAFASQEFVFNEDGTLRQELNEYIRLSSEMTLPMVRRIYGTIHQLGFVKLKYSDEPLPERKMKASWWFKSVKDYEKQRNNVMLALDLEAEMCAITSDHINLEIWFEMMNKMMVGTAKDELKKEQDFEVLLHQCTAYLEAKCGNKPTHCVMSPDVFKVIEKLSGFSSKVDDHVNFSGSPAGEYEGIKIFVDVFPPRETIIFFHSTEKNKLVEMTVHHPLDLKSFFEEERRRLDRRTIEFLEEDDIICRKPSILASYNIEILNPDAVCVGILELPKEEV